MNQSLWRDRRVLLTGHTGFKGSWLSKWLDLMGAQVLGVSLKADGFSPYEKLIFSDRFQSLEADISVPGEWEHAIAEFQPEVVLHLAAQALVGRAFEQPVEAFQSNVMGTVHLLESVRSYQNLRAVVVVTSDKVYENRETGQAFTENDRLGGMEPYSASKVCQEQVTTAYGRSYLCPRGVGVATARGSNVYGGGDYHYDRLIPGLIGSILQGNQPEIRNPNAVRPWQYVLCLLEGYLRLAEELMEHPGSSVEGWNFGPHPSECVSVGQIAQMLSGRAVLGAEASFAEAELLCLNAGKSEAELGWRVQVPLKNGLQRTLEFYRREYEGEQTDDLMREELEHYVQTCDSGL